MKWYSVRPCRSERFLYMYIWSESVLSLSIYIEYIYIEHVHRICTQCVLHIYKRVECVFICIQTRIS